MLYAIYLTLEDASSRLLIMGDVCRDLWGCTERKEAKSHRRFSDKRESSAKWAGRNLQGRYHRRDRATNASFSRFSVSPNPIDIRWILSGMDTEIKHNSAFLLPNYSLCTSAFELPEYIRKNVASEKLAGFPTSNIQEQSPSPQMKMLCLRFYYPEMRKYTTREKHSSCKNMEYTS